MIEEPVVNLSESLTRPTSGEVQITISSAKRDRCTDAIAAAESVSITKSRSDTASSEFAIGPSNSSASAVMSRSIGNDVPASAAAPSGKSFSRDARVGEPAAVARRHLDVSEKMMPERHRLRGLQMREARHHRAGVLQRLLGQRLLVVAEQPVDVVDPRPHPQPEIGRDLIVARARGVQPAGGRPDQLGEPALDVHMDVFERRLNWNLPEPISDRIVSRP